MPSPVPVINLRVRIIQGGFASLANAGLISLIRSGDVRRGALGASGAGSKWPVFTSQKFTTLHADDMEISIRTF